MISKQELKEVHMRRSYFQRFNLEQRRMCILKQENKPKLNKNTSWEILIHLFVYKSPVQPKRSKLMATISNDMFQYPEITKDKC